MILPKKWNWRRRWERRGKNTKHDISQETEWGRRKWSWTSNYHTERERERERGGGEGGREEGMEGEGRGERERERERVRERERERERERVFEGVWKRTESTMRSKTSMRPALTVNYLSKNYTRSQLCIPGTVSASTSPDTSHSLLLTSTRTPSCFFEVNSRDATKTNNP